MTASDMARKLNGMADSDRNNLNHQDRLFLKEVAKKLMHKPFRTEQTIQQDKWQEDYQKNK